MAQITAGHRETDEGRGTTKGRRDVLFGWLMSAPAFLGLFIFLVIPFIMAFGLSFTDQRFLSPNPTDFIGLRNYSRLLSVSTLTLEPLVDEETGQPVRNEAGELQFPRVRNFTRNEEEYPQYDGFKDWFHIDVVGRRIVILAKDPVFLRSIINNFYFALVAVPLQSSLALFLAVLVNQKLKGINIFRTIYFAPVVTAMVVISVVWTFLYEKSGLINQFLQAISGGYLGPFDWLSSPQSAMIAIIIMSVWQGVGFQMVIFLAGLQDIPEVLYESAKIDGANRWERFWDITVPQLRNTIAFVAISTTILAFRLFTQIDVMTQGGPRDATTTVVFYAVKKGYQENDIGYASAISVIFFIIVFVISMIQRWITQRRGRVR